MLYQPTLVSKDFYELSKASFPEVFEDVRFSRLFDHLLFSNFKDDETGYIVTPEFLLADMEDLSHKLTGGNRNYRRAKAFPLEFSEATGIELLQTEYNFTRGRAMSYQMVGIPKSYTDALEVKAPSFGYDDTDVFFDRGRKFTAREEDASVKRFKMLKSEYMCNLHYDWDVSFLNSSSYKSNFLNRGFQDRLDAAKRAASRLPSKKRIANTNILNKLLTFEPWYKAEDNYRRIYAAGSSLQNLSSSVRSAILAPSVNYDLKAAQLAIMAQHWEVFSILDLLHRGNVWETICLSLSIHPDRKSEAKRLVYSTAFGMSQDSLAAQYGELTGKVAVKTPQQEIPQDTLDSLFGELNSNRYFKELLKGRSRALSRVGRDGGAIGPDGNFVSQYDFSGTWENGKKGRTILAYEMQTREKWIMEPVVDIAREEEKHLLISLWIHDGVYIHYFKPESRRAKMVEAEMFRRVKERAGMGNYPTELAVA